MKTEIFLKTELTTAGERRLQYSTQRKFNENGNPSMRRLLCIPYGTVVSAVLYGYGFLRNHYTKGEF